jgi:hypothetical protein
LNPRAGKSDASQRQRGHSALRPPSPRQWRKIDAALEVKRQRAELCHRSRDRKLTPPRHHPANRVFHPSRPNQGGRADGEIEPVEPALATDLNTILIVQQAKGDRRRQRAIKGEPRVPVHHGAVEGGCVRIGGHVDFKAILCRDAQT